MSDDRGVDVASTPNNAPLRVNLDPLARRMMIA